MKKLIVGAAALLSALTGVLATATPAAADGWRGGYGHGYASGRGYGGGYGYRGYDHRGYGAGPAIVAGLAGLAIGASLSHPHPYYAGPRYYAGPPPAYYVGRTYYGYYEGCRREWVWDYRWGGYRAVEACF